MPEKQALNLNSLRYNLLKTVLIMSTLLISSAFAQSLTLSDVLAAALATNKSNVNEVKQSKNSSSWLASSPRIGMSYLKSNEALGTDEAEINLTLPFKSLVQSELDGKLISANHVTKQLMLANKKLMFSGLIRQQIWGIQIARSSVKTLENKLAFLTQLEQQYQQLLLSSTVTTYPLLLIKQEVLATKIQLLEINGKAAELLGQYQRLTGLNDLPDNINEVSLVAAEKFASLLINHSVIKKLDHDWAEQKFQIALANNQSEPWTLSITAKNVESQAFSEQQIGLAAEVPLTIFNIEKQSLSNEWLQGETRYQLSRTQLLLELTTIFQSLKNQQQLLIQKQQLLAQTKKLSKTIIKDTQLLVEAQQIEQDQALRRILNAFNNQSIFTLNQLLLLKNNAMLRQAAGISL